MNISSYCLPNSDTVWDLSASLPVALTPILRKPNGWCLSYYANPALLFCLSSVLKIAGQERPDRHRPTESIKQWMVPAVDTQLNQLFHTQFQHSVVLEMVWLATNPDLLLWSTGMCGIAKYETSMSSAVSHFWFELHRTMQRMAWSRSLDSSS